MAEPESVEVNMRRVQQPLRVLFPPERPASALIIAILVRADEISYIVQQLNSTTEEVDRRKLGDQRQVLDRFMLTRFATVSLDDGMQKLLRFKDLPEIRRQIRSHGLRGKRFRASVCDLGIQVQQLSPIRHQLGAHFDQETIGLYLRGLQGDVVGELWLAQGHNITTHFDANQYDAAHLVIAGTWVQAIAGRERSVVDTEVLQELPKLVSKAKDAQIKFMALARVAVILFEASLQEGSDEG